MQLPRGKFREIVRGVPLGPLLLELNEVQYTGILKINWDSSSSTLVFQNGLVLLAELPPYAGDAAWEALTRLGNQSVGGILSDLDAVQLKLVIEFNGPFLLAAPATPGKETAGRKRPPQAGAPVAVPQPEPVPVTGEGPARAAPPARPEGEKAGYPAGGAGSRVAVPGRPPVTPAGQGGPSPSPREGPPAGRPMVAPPAARGDGGAGSGTATPHTAMDPATLATLEMEALDDVDVDHIASKVRKNARGIVKKLHLGHLMTEKDE